MNPTPMHPGSQPDYSQYTTRESADESYKIKDGAGGRDIFIDDIRNVPKYQESLGRKLMDIIMYPAGANHPLVVAGKIKQGTMVHMTWAFIHKNIGPGQDWFICLARTYGLPCPVCELRNQIKSTPGLSDEEVKLAIQPYYSGKYPLGIYNCVHHNNPAQISWQESVMYWPVNNSFMESKLQSMSKSPIGGGFVNYQWPTAGEQGGRHIAYEVIQKGQFFDYIGHQFVMRQSPVPMHILQQAICLDDYLDVPEYDQVKAALEAGLGNPVGGQPTGGTIGYPPAMSMPQPPWFDDAPEPQCPFSEHGGIIGASLDSWEECQVCQIRVECQAKAAPPPPPPTPQAPTPAPAPSTGGTNPVPRPVPIPRRPQR